tara:strand:+ start:476 stop:643 length:168 start_codon:yes stop_codon:yes gene_type:complete
MSQQSTASAGSAAEWAGIGFIEKALCWKLRRRKNEGPQRFAASKLDGRQLSVNPF